MTNKENSRSDDDAPPNAWIREHLRRYLETDGEDGHIVNGYKTLLLTTLGRKSKKTRTTPLIYGEDDGNYIIVASKGGADVSPGWFYNLSREPLVKVQVKADKFQALARVATAEERQRLWPLMVEIFPEYATYQTKTTREIPVVILSRS